MKTVDILTVCGVGSGSSLILRMYVEDVLEELEIPYHVQTGQASEARSSRADIVLCSHEFLNVTEGASARVVPIGNFTDKEEIRKILTPVLKEMGFLK